MTARNDWRFLLLALAVLAGVTPVHAQESRPSESRPSTQSRPSTRKDARTQVLEMLAKQGVHFDSKKELVRAEGKINVTRDFLEFVAIGPRGKKHEALVMLRCLGSTLNTALALLKLPKGKNVEYEKIVPMPTKEEYEAGAPLVRVIPPKGEQIHIAVRWKDKKGKTVTYSVDDLILDIRADKTLQHAQWIYLGGRMAALYRGEPPVYIADYEQNYISNYYIKPDNQLISIKHERGNYDDNWWPNEHLLPERGTPCEILISRKPIVKRLPLKEAYPDSGKQLREPGENSGTSGGRPPEEEKKQEEAGEPKK